MASGPSGATYLNPVYPHSAPDPFVLKHLGEYWCYFTGLHARSADAPDILGGRAFGVLHSPDLVHWQPVGGALDLLPGDNPCYWAPEVTYDNGRFYMYYSVGDEVHMQIRVAVADHPAGPFNDSGHRLTGEGFAIDAHVFTDDDGARYLFYATDFLTYSRIGTGTVFARLQDPFTLAGPGRPVTRAAYDWQIYDPHRASKGGVCWHTVEGPFVLKHNRRYYQMFSGGNWQNASYGVSYAVTGDLAAEGEWQQTCNGVDTLPILRTRPELGVIGPGHNSVVRGPDNVELYCVYHRWQPATAERVLAIDRLGWEGDDLVVYGPSTTPQPAPHAPDLSGFASLMLVQGEWQLVEDRAVLLAWPGAASAVGTALPAGDWVLEVSVRLRAGVQGVPQSGLAQGGAGVALMGAGGGPAPDPGGELVRVSVLGDGRAALLAAVEAPQYVSPPQGLDPRVYHLLRVERAGETLSVGLDGAVARWQVALPQAPEHLQLVADGAMAEFAALAITRVEHDPA